jgi:uracil-DNA glycosylase
MIAVTIRKARRTDVRELTALHSRKEPAMNPSRSISCKDFPCATAVHESYVVPDLHLDPSSVRLVMIGECAPASVDDHFTAGGDSLFAKTTLLAFREAGHDVPSIRDLAKLGVYLTTAVKCGKKESAVPREAIQNCSLLLEQELALFPNTEVILLMGDVAIAAINIIARRKNAPRPIPAGSTYKIRGGRFVLEGIRLFPSYLHAGAAFFVEKGKRRMIAEDIAAGMKLIRSHRRASA